MLPSPPSYRRYIPHSILDRGYWSTVTTSVRTKPTIDRMQELLQRIPPVPTQPLASEFLAAKRSNNRGPLDVYWQETRAFLSQLVVNRCVDGKIDTGIDDTLLNWLWAFSTSPSWVVSAHLPGNDLPFTASPQLDLASCEMAANLAETLELIKPWVDNQSQTLARTIVHEIDRRVLAPFVEPVAEWWFDPDQLHNNWTGVCAGSILAACEALAAIGEPRPQAREKAIHMLNLFLEKAFTPGGECDEGVGYWNYGVGVACVGWSRLSESEFRTKVDVERLKAVSDYPRQAHLFGNTFFSGNDGSYHVIAPLFASTWLAGATESAWLTEWSADATIDAGTLRNIPMVTRGIDAVLHLDPLESKRVTHAASRFLTDQQVAVFMSQRLAVYLSGGHNDESHNHNDLGQFGLFCDQQPIVADLGAPSYTSDFFGPKRYTYLSTSSRGHCVPIINGQEQVASAAAAGRVVAVDLDRRRAVLDLTAAYPADANLIRWQRSLTLESSAAIIEDEFVTSEAVEIESVIWAVLKPRHDKGSLLLGDVTLKVTPSVEVIVTEVDPASHRLKQFTDPIYRIAFKVRTQSGETLRTLITMSA